MTATYKEYQLVLVKEYISNNVYTEIMHGGTTPAGSSKFIYVMCLDMIKNDSKDVWNLRRSEMYWDDGYNRWRFKRPLGIRQHIRTLIHDLPYAPTGIELATTTSPVDVVYINLSS